MSKFRELMEATLKEWNYPDGFDDSILDGDPAEEGDWLEEQFAVKIIGGTTPSGLSFEEDYGVEIPYVCFNRKTKEFSVIEELLPADYSVDMKRSNETGSTVYNRDYYSTFYSEEEAKKMAEGFKVDFPNAELQIIKVYGYSDHQYYEDPSVAVNAYIDEYKEDMATPEYEPDYD